MRSWRRWFASIVVVGTMAGTLLVGPPAGASEPAGGCPPPYGEPISVEEFVAPPLVALAEHVDTLGAANQDGYVCFRPVATNNQTGWLEVVIMIDNRIP